MTDPTTFNLDDLEREGAAAPFEITLGGERILMADAQEIDWKALMSAMSDPHEFFRLVVPAADQAKFFGTEIPTWKMRALMESYTKHYGLAAPGEASALPR